MQCLVHIFILKVMIAQVPLLPLPQVTMCTCDEPVCTMCIKTHHKNEGAQK